MKKYIIHIIVFVFIVDLYTLSSQTKTTKEAKVIAVVEDNRINALLLFENDENQKEKLIQKYPKSKFYIGLLNGRYELKGNVIIPKSEATIILYTEKQLFTTGELFKNKRLKQGDAINIGNTKAKVIATKKGELIIKTNN